MNIFSKYSYCCYSLSPLPSLSMPLSYHALLSNKHPTRHIYNILLTFIDEIFSYFAKPKILFFNFLLCYLETNELKVLTKLSNRALPQVEYLCQLFYCTIIPILLYQIHDFPNEGRRIIEYKLWILS